VIVRQVRHMTNLVDDLLDVSRVTRGLVELRLEPVDVKSVVASALEQARPLIEARHHEVDLHVGSSQGWVRGDRTRLVQIVTNLLNNAAKYTPQNGRISLSVESDAAHVRIAVGDNGVGIGADLLPHVFDIFTQAERTPDRAQGGLGLGLALVKSLTALHGGSVAAHSDGPGQGSRFVLTLPVVAPRAVAAKQAGGGAAHIEAGACRILIVDDNVDAVESLADILRALGHAVATATCGEDALAGAAADWPDVFILDIGLPDLHGYELVRRLREQGGDAARAAGTLYLALTGYGQAHDRALSRSAGFDHHLVKPVDLERLLGLLNGDA
jgi:CheY-like chemotaxis protein